MTFGMKVVSTVNFASFKYRTIQEAALVITTLSKPKSFLATICCNYEFAATPHKKRPKTLKNNLKVIYTIVVIFINYRIAHHHIWY
jgi:hypothetical protein